MRMQPREIVTEKELAKELRVSLRGLINLRNRRLIPDIRLGRSVRYDRAAVEKALEKLTVTELAFCKAPAAGPFSQAPSAAPVGRAPSSTTTGRAPRPYRVRLFQLLRRSNARGDLYRFPCRKLAWTS
jgi:hypothetical protein